jgi:hypothetical protein
MSARSCLALLAGEMDSRSSLFVRLSMNVAHLVQGERNVGLARSRCGGLGDGGSHGRARERAEEIDQAFG